MKKKIVAFMLVISMLAIALIGGTLAYFTDDDQETNTFTVGSVEIDLIESQYHRVVDAAEGATQVSDDALKADAETYKDAYLAVQGNNIVPGRWVRKAPYIVNTGDNAAYIRVRLLIDKNLFDYFHVMQTTTAINEGDITRVSIEDCTVGNTTYVELTYVYNEALDPEEMTYWPAFWQFKLDDACDKAEIEALTTAGAIDANGQFNILVYADAIQAEGFTTAAEAFAAFDGQ